MTKKPRRTTRYVTVMEGEGPGTSRAIIATSDPETVRRVCEILRERMNIAASPLDVGAEA